MVFRVISYGRQTLDEDDIDAVVTALRAERITQGSLATVFEHQLSEYCCARAAVALCNGTMALYLCARAMGLRAGGLLWTSPNSYVASANCAHYCGADVDFVDIDCATGNMDVVRLHEKLLQAECQGRLPDIVVPVHFAGQSCDMQVLGQLAQRFGFRVIEDACHALGGTYQGEKVGSCRWSDAVVFSFHPVKSITTGEGGMVLSNDEALIERVRLLANGGVSKNAHDMPWYCDMPLPGINARMSELHAALGISQIKKLDYFIAQRRTIATRYLRELSHLPLHLPPLIDGVESAWHLFVVRVVDAVGRDALCQALGRAGVAVNVHYVPIHRHSWYRQRGFSQGDFPCAERHFDTAITLPLYPAMTPEQVAYVVTALRENVVYEKPALAVA